MPSPNFVFPPELTITEFFNYIHSLSDGTYKADNWAAIFQSRAFVVESLTLENIERKFQQRVKEAIEWKEQHRDPKSL